MRTYVQPQDLNEGPEEIRPPWYAEYEEAD